MCPREMLALGEAGYREVTLLGQNIDAYGRDLPGTAADGSGRRANTFTDLLRYVHDVPGTCFTYVSETCFSDVYFRRVFQTCFCDE